MTDYDGYHNQPDWEQFTERLEQYFVAHGEDVRDLLAPVKPATKSYLDLVEVLKPKRLIIAVFASECRRRARWWQPIWLHCKGWPTSLSEYGTHLT